MTDLTALIDIAPTDIEAASEVAAPTIPMETLFRDLFDQHRDRLYRFVLRHIGHATDAEDLAQQAFVEAARTYAQFRGESQLSTWLYGIAMNLVRNHLSRAPHRLHRFDDDSALENTAANTPSPEEQCAMTELVASMNEELAGLMPEMREVLLLVAHNDMSYEDCAALLHVPIGTVRSRVSRARSHLRRRMADRGAILPF
jgi:RNA polymerase sigma factor (sigma-70 family)